MHRRFLVATALVLLAGCASQPDDNFRDPSLCLDPNIGAARNRIELRGHVDRPGDPAQRGER